MHDDAGRAQIRRIDGDQLYVGDVQNTGGDPAGVSVRNQFGWRFGQRQCRCMTIRPAELACGWRGRGSAQERKEGVPRKK